MKIRLKSAIGKGPIELKVLPGPKGKIIFDANGEVDVPNQIGAILLGPGHEGEGYELVEESKKEVKIKREKDAMTQDAPDERLRRHKEAPVETGEVKEFLAKV